MLSLASDTALGALDDPDVLELSASRCQVGLLPVGVMSRSRAHDSRRL